MSTVRPSDSVRLGGPATTDEKRPLALLERSLSTRSRFSKQSRKSTFRSERSRFSSVTLRLCSMSLNCIRADTSAVFGRRLAWVSLGCNRSSDWTATANIIVMPALA